MSDINLIIQNTTPANLTLSTALGEQGPQGPQGQAGANAPVNVVSIGTVSTGAEGSSASASMTGTAPNQTLNLTIPRGNTGATGATGATGPANALLIGSVTTGSPGDNATASITGTAPNQILNLTLPRGATGATGPQGAVGPVGPANSLAIGTVSTAASGVSASATITGTAPNQTLNLTLPKGDTGATGATGSTAGVSTNTPSTVVQRDSSGNFSAGTITASLNGNATTATTASTASAIADGAVSTTAKIANGVVTAAKLGTNERLQICKSWVNLNGTTGATINTALPSTHTFSCVAGGNTLTWTTPTAFFINTAGQMYSFVILGSSTFGGANVSAMTVATSVTNSNTLTLTLPAGSTFTSTITNQSAGSTTTYRELSTIRASYNVSSVTKLGGGNYQVSFQTPMADANYAVAVAATPNSGCSTQLVSQTSSALRFTVNNSSVNNDAYDPTIACVTIFGN